MTTFFQSRINAAKALHWRRGVGDIREVRFFADGRIEIDAKPYGMPMQTRKGRIVSTGKPFAYQIRMYGTRLRFVEIGEMGHAC